MTLKDRQVEQDEEEKLWYDRAFGELRNIMRIKFLFNPPAGAISTDNKSKYVFRVRLTYNIFPELADEFSSERYPQESYIELEDDLDENDNQEWSFEDDWPYGDYKCELEFKNPEAAEGE